MHNKERTVLMEHLALKSALTLREFCTRLQDALDLPEFRFDSENETEWGLVEVDNIEYNVSRPYETGTLQKWDDTVPQDCNFGISLIMYREHPNASNHEWAVNHLVVPVAQKIADEFDTPVRYHRTWCGPGDKLGGQTLNIHF